MKNEKKKKKNERKRNLHKKKCKLSGVYRLYWKTRRYHVSCKFFSSIKNFEYWKKTFLKISLGLRVPARQKIEAAISSRNERVDFCTLKRRANMVFFLDWGWGGRESKMGNFYLFLISLMHLVAGFG